jgi:IMP dehydrogenase
MVTANTALSYDDILLYPHKGKVASRSDVDISIRLGNWTLPTPFISSPMETVTDKYMARALFDNMAGLGVLHRFGVFADSRASTDKLRGWGVAPIATAIGYGDMERLYLENVDIFVLDVAHAYSIKVLEWISMIKRKRPDVYLIAGSIATAAGALEVLDAGADALRVGIGSGAACTTRTVTGFGVPMVTAIQEVASVAKHREVPIIADGGIKNSGDVVKALAVGADAVMLGRLLAGCDEAPLQGSYFGQASSKSAASNGSHIEGASGEIEDVGPVAGVIEQLSQGLRSGISYGGGTNIKEMQAIAAYNIVTPLSMVESGTRI